MTSLSLAGLGIPVDFLPKYETVRFLKVSVIVFESFHLLEITSQIKFESDLVNYMHMQVDALGLRAFPEILFELFHHLPADIVLAVWFQHHEGENVGV